MQWLSELRKEYKLHYMIVASQQVSYPIELWEFAVPYERAVVFMNVLDIFKMFVEVCDKLKAKSVNKAYEGWRRPLAGLQVPSSHLRLGRVTSLTGEPRAGVEADELRCFPRMACSMDSLIVLV